MTTRQIQEATKQLRKPASQLSAVDVVRASVALGWPHWNQQLANHFKVAEPAGFHACLASACAHESLSLFEGALSQYAAALELASCYEEKLVALERHGHMLNRIGRYHQAHDSLAKAEHCLLVNLGGDPREVPWVYLSWSRNHIDRGDLDKAENVLEYLEDPDPDQAAIDPLALRATYCLLAEVDLLRGERPKAADSLEKADRQADRLASVIPSELDDVMLQHRLLDVLTRAHTVRQADADANILADTINISEARQHPLTPKLCLTAGLLAVQYGDQAAARRHANRGLKSYEDHDGDEVFDHSQINTRALVRGMKARCLFALGEPRALSEAMVALRQACDSGVRAVLLRLQATILRSHGRFDSAEFAEQEARVASLTAVFNVFTEFTLWK